jgi:aminomethyltransferase
MSQATTSLHRTPFHGFHVGRGARMVEFAGWEMPMLYRSIIEEHRQVRRSGGIFDVSHMGRLRIGGPDAGRFLDRACTRAIQSMEAGQCRYSLVCNRSGGCRDDVLVYRVGPAEYVMVCNAANREKVLVHLDEVRGTLAARVDDETFVTGMVAIQGPAVIELLAALAPQVAQLRRYRFTSIEVLGPPIIVSRTGYTGEDGVEVILPVELAEPAIELLSRTVGGADAAIEPAGLGARDTLRMEAAMPLYGHEIDEEHDPLSAGLSFAVKLDKGERDGAEPFVGQEALRRIARKGSGRRLCGLHLEGPRTARQGMRVLSGGRRVGEVTSACLSPTLGRPIAMAYLDAAHCALDNRVEVELGRGSAAAQIVALPFYKR